MNARDIKRIAPAVSVISFILGWAHYFIYLSISRSLSGNEFYLVPLVILLTLGAVSIPVGFLISLTTFKQKFRFLTWFAYIWMGFFHLLFFSSTLERVLTLFVEHPYSYWNLFFSLIVGLWALYRGLQSPRVVVHRLKATPLMVGLKLVQVSDLHVGLLHLNAKWLSNIVNIVNNINPDVFAITGDLVEGPFQEVSPLLAVLKEAKAKLEKFYITGNHEYIHGSGPWEKRMRELGYTTLHNENKIIHYQKAKILFAGVPDRMVSRFDPRLSSQPDVALSSKQTVDYKILLAHEPASRWDLKTESCDLILSGHTHGGQIFPFGLIVRIVQPVVAGFKQMGQVLVFAHQGTGLWGPPMRWFSRSEIVVFHFT